MDALRLKCYLTIIIKLFVYPFRHSTPFRRKNFSATEQPEKAN